MSAAAPRVAPRRHGYLRRTFFRNVERALRLAGGRRWYRSRHLAPGRFLVREERIDVPDLPAGLEGLRIAQLSDFHAGPFLAGGDLDHVVAAVNALEPHLCALTGDFITRHWTEALFIADALEALRPTHGTFAVFGNHDYKQRLEAQIVAAYQERGVRFLRNESAAVEVDGATLRVVGLEDLEEGREVDLESARRGLEDGQLELMLCHNPLGAPALARPGCVAVLAGHTHGGQVDIASLRWLGPIHPGLRLRIGPTTLIVSRGLGVVGVPFRFRAPAEVVLVTLQRAKG